MASIILFLGLMFTGLCQGSFYISTDKSKWSDQNSPCTASTPEVKAAVDTDYQLNETLDLDFPYNESVWVGYYQVERVFEYIGCASFTTLFNNYEERSYVEINGDPGHCFPECGNDTVIGVTKTRCYCLGSDVQDHTETECTDKCESPLVACGNDAYPVNNSYLSIYKMNTDVTVGAIFGATEDNNCLAIHSKTTFFWEKCSSTFDAVCSVGVYFKRLFYKIGSAFSWIAAANECFQKKSLPTIYSNSKEASAFDDPIMWSGMFKTNVIYKRNTEIPANRRHDPKKYGYLARDPDNKAKLQFTETDTDKRTLCDDDENVTRTVLSSSQESVTTSFSDFSVPTEANMADMSTESSFDTYLVIGVCGSVVLNSVVIVTLICVFVRRMGLNTSNHSNYLTPTYIATSLRNNATGPPRPDSNRTSVRFDGGDLVSMHYYTTPTEIVNQNSQSLQQVADRSNETLSSLEIGGGRQGILYTTGDIGTGASESLQDRTTESHIYDDPTDETCDSVEECMKDEHFYIELEN